MKELRYSDHFHRRAKKLPKGVQQKLAYLLDILRGSPYHPLLHTKPLTGFLEGRFSFRITRDWRVVFKALDENTLLLIDIAHRKDIYRR